MLRIGEFASLTGMSIHMLRHYGKIGLLVPKHTGDTSNYRYYSENQILEANRIQILKELGFGLKEIAKINSCSNNEIQQLIESKIIERQKSAEHIMQQIRLMRQTAGNIDKYGDMVFSAKLISFTVRKVVSLRGKISKFEDEGLLWERLDHICRINGVKTLGDEYSYAITHSIDLRNNIIDTEVQREVSEILPIESELRFYEMPAVEAAAVTVRGVYSRISDISCYVHNYIKDMGYEIYGVPLRRYFLSPRNGCDPRDYITEYYFTLKNISKTS